MAPPESENLTAILKTPRRGPLLIYLYRPATHKQPVTQPVAGGSHPAPPPGGMVKRRVSCQLAEFLANPGNQVYS